MSSAHGVRDAVRAERECSRLFTGFTDETVRFLMDLRFHNYTEYFHENHDRYVKAVQEPFYAMIDELAPVMLEIDPMMEVRPHRCLSRIHRDTRFTKDKSPYRDHHWFLFRRAAEPREKSLFCFFEFGPDQLGWGMGFWGENREALDIFRKRMAADPAAVKKIVDGCRLAKHGLEAGGTLHRRLAVPDNIPNALVRWYLAKELYISKAEPDRKSAFSGAVAKTVAEDFKALQPLYRCLRGVMDEV